MIPILYDTNEIVFANNGICRLRDCISAIVTEERNGIYELDFEYPITGANYDLIQLGRIVAVTHDDTGDVQPFDIVSYTKPIDGIVTFHCTHISYRQSYYTFVPPKNSIQSLTDAFTMFEERTAPAPNPFHYSTNITSSAYAACADGLPHSVRQMLGGMEGSLLDTYGGEYEWNKWNVILHSARGTVRDFTIRYGVNMLEYNDETNNEGAFSSCIPYWANGDDIVWGTPIGANSKTITQRKETVPLDLTDKFENKPTATQLRNAAKSYMDSNQTFLPVQTINVSFVRLQDMGEYADFQNLLTCRLCDTINVIFPDYKTQGQFKIVKTVWNVLEKRFEEMELGTLSTSLSEALGISQTGADRTSSAFLNLSVDNLLSVGGNITAGGNITVGGHDSEIGYRTPNQTGSYSLATGTSWVTVPAANLTRITLSQGTWIMVARASFASNSTGRRALRIYDVTTNEGIGRSSVTQSAVNGATTDLITMAILVMTTGSETYTLQVAQNSGNPRNVDLQFHAVRIA